MTEPALPPDDILDRVAATIASRRDADPASSYVAAKFCALRDKSQQGVQKAHTEPAENTPRM